MKKLMVIAGGRWQIPLVKKAKEMGYHVLCSNMYDDSPAFLFSDEKAVANVLDKDKNLEIARKFKPDVVVSDQSDIAVPTVAYLCDKLGLNGVGVETAKRFTNKYEMRKCAKEAGIPCPEFAKCNTIEELYAFFDKYEDIFIKPLDSQSSRGVCRITNRKQLQNAFISAIAYSNSEKAVMAEQFIPGVEFTVDGVMFADGHKSMLVSQKEHYSEYPGVASHLYFRHSNEDYDYISLKLQNDKLVNSMHLPFGLTHAEYMYKDGVFYLVEVAARGGGTNISSAIMQYMTGIDTNRILIEMAAGNTISGSDYIINEELCNNCCILKFFEFKKGRVKAIHGEDRLSDNPNVLDYDFNFEIGSVISDPSDDSRRPGFYIAAGSEKSRLDRLVDEIEEKVYLEYY